MKIRKKHFMGCNMNPTSYSNLEGQLRCATDIEIYTAARILNVKTDALFEMQE